MVAVLCSPLAGAFPREVQGVRKAPIWRSEMQGKSNSRKERTTASHAGAQALCTPQALQAFMVSLLPFNLIHTELPNFRLTPSASSHLFHVPTPDSDTSRGQELLYLCKHTRAPSSSSSKPSQLPPSLPPAPHPPQRAPCLVSTPRPRILHGRDIQAFNSCSTQRAERVITFASPGLNRTHSSSQQPHSSRAG